MNDSTTIVPPAAAVARDAHWQAKLARVKARAPMRRTVVLKDDAAHDALNAAKMNAHVVEEKVAERLRLQHASLDPAERAVAVAEAIDVDPSVQAARNAVQEAEAAVDEADVAFTFQALPGDVFEALVGKFPPTDEQAAAGEGYNVKRFAPALLAACCVDPMTPVDAAQLIGGETVDEDTGAVTVHNAVLSQGESSILYQGAVTVNQGARASMGKG